MICLSCIISQSMGKRAKLVLDMMQLMNKFLWSIQAWNEVLTRVGLVEEKAMYILV